MKDIKEYRIGVLAGGSSSERQISLKSGNAVFNALKEAGFNVELVDVKEEDFASIIDVSAMEVAFIALHGAFGEDGIVQSELALRNIPYTGSGPGPSHAALDKLASKKLFTDHGLKVPDHLVVKAGGDVSGLDIPFPCVVKPRYEGSSIGLSIVPSPDRLAEALEAAEPYGRDIIIEKFIAGRELTVGILDEAALPVVEIIPSGGVYDYGAKYHSGDTEYVVPARLDEDTTASARRIGLAAHKALGCEFFSRVDMRLSTEGEIFVLEVNTIPGLTERSLLPMAAKAEGIDFRELCVRMLRGAIKTRLIKGGHCGEKESAKN